MNIINVDPKEFVGEAPEKISQNPQLWLHSDESGYGSLNEARVGQHRLAVSLGLGKIAKEYPFSFTDNRSWHVDGVRGKKDVIVYNAHATYTGRGFMFVAEQVGAPCQLITPHLGDVGIEAVTAAEDAARGLIEQGHIGEDVYKIPIYSGVTAFWVEDHRSKGAKDTAHAVVSTSHSEFRRSVVTEYLP